jgi:hypothetical protein
MRRGWVPDEPLDFLLDGTIPQHENDLADQDVLDREQDRFNDMFDACPYPLADWYAPGAARVGNTPGFSLPGTRVAAATPPSGSDQPSTGSQS